MEPPEKLNSAVETYLSNISDYDVLKLLNESKGRISEFEAVLKEKNEQIKTLKELNQALQKQANNVVPGRQFVKLKREISVTATMEVLEDDLQGSTYNTSQSWQTNPYQSLEQSTRQDLIAITSPFSNSRKGSIGISSSKATSQDDFALDFTNTNRSNNYIQQKQNENTKSISSEAIHVKAKNERAQPNYLQVDPQLGVARSSSEGRLGTVQNEQTEHKVSFGDVTEFKNYNEFDQEFNNPEGIAALTKKYLECQETLETKNSQLKAARQRNVKLKAKVVSMQLEIESLKRIGQKKKKRNPKKKRKKKKAQNTSRTGISKSISVETFSVEDEQTKSFERSSSSSSVETDSTSVSEANYDDYSYLLKEGENDEAIIALDDTDKVPSGPQETINIVLEADQTGVDQVMAGTIEKLVQRLTYEKFPDPEYVNDFLMTYLSFSSPAELINLLILRFKTSPPPDANVTTFEKVKLLPIQLRVFNVLKTWISTYYSDIANADPRQIVKPKLKYLMHLMAQGNMANASRQLNEKMKSQAKQLKRDLSTTSLQATFDEAPPQSLITKGVDMSSPTLTLLDFHPEEVARQLTLIEHGIFRDITARECLYKAAPWKQEDNRKIEGTPHIIRSSGHWNTVVSWVQTEILQQREIKGRGAYLKQFILIADKCLKLNNFSTVFAIHAAIKTTPIWRLKQSLDKLSNNVRGILTDLTNLTQPANNMANYREALSQVQPPCVPHVATYLSDLNSINEIFTATIESQAYGREPGGKSLINFAKFRAISELVKHIQKFQQHPYHLHPVQSIQKYFVAAEKITDDEELYTLSEKRESTKIAASPSTSFLSPLSKKFSS